jgi:hypothetical protein
MQGQQIWNSEIRIWNFNKAITNKQTTKTKQQEQNKQGIENADPLEAGKYLLLTCIFAEVLLQHI